MDELRFVIAKNLVFLRKTYGYTQAEVAKKLDYTDKSVSKWETGECVPPIEVLKKLADFYKITLDQLVSEESLKVTTEPTQERVHHSKFAISLLAIITIWLIATCGFSFGYLGNIYSNSWLIFIYAVPASFICALVFNSIWGKRRMNYVIVSFLIWTLLAAFYLTCVVIFDKPGYWPLFFIGIPSQIIVIIWSGIKGQYHIRRKNKKAK
jgi:transcriptional regulator with XRE-family HTH domain